MVDKNQKKEAVELIMDFLDHVVENTDYRVYGRYKDSVTIKIPQGWGTKEEKRGFWFSFKLDVPTRTDLKSEVQRYMDTIH